MKDLKDYFAELSRLFNEINAFDAAGKIIDFWEALEISIGIITSKASEGGKIILVGNGGSAAVASHIAVDLLKNAHIPALAFNDASSLSCIGNDLGFEEVFAKPISSLGNAADVLIAVSSSGKSANILKAVDAAKNNGLTILTFSGFAEDNPLRKKGKVNFYLPSKSYGYVEITHLAICHCIVDEIIKNKKKNG